VSTFDPTAGMPLWFARTGRPDGSMSLACVLGTEHPYRHVVDAVAGAGKTILYRADYAAGGEMTRAAVDPAFADRAVDLWFVEMPEPLADPPATNLVAYATPEWPDGTVVAADEAERSGVDPREQVGAVRWWTATGQVHQVYVAAHMRRRRIGTKLVLTGAALTVGRRWPSLWANGELTDMGQAWITGSVWAPRVAPRTRVVPPMTPGEAD
jgi:GNAT superfamily N-acetyltransferase